MDDEVSKVKQQKKTNALFVLACARGYIEDLKALLDRGASVQAVDKKNVSGLHFACAQGRLEVVKYLWTRGGELDTEDPAGNLPLHYAIIGNKPSVVSFLLEKGAWVEGSNSLDDTPLHIAARKGQQEIVADLLEHGARATLRDVNKRGLTPLGEALLAGDTAVATQLIKAGANAESKAKGYTLLHMSAAAGSAAGIKLLLEHKAEVHDAGNEDGYTPLHCAALSGSQQAAKLLLTAGADPAVASIDGRRPFELVPDGNKDLQKLLETRGPPKTPLVSLKTASPQLPTTDAEDFLALGSPERKARVEKWATISEPEQLDKALMDFPLELKTQIIEFQRLQQIMKIQQAILELLEDDDFQTLAQHPQAKVIVEEVHTNREAFLKYAEKADVMNLLRALQRFQAVVRANGGHQIPFQSLLRSCEPGYQKKVQEKSVLRLKGMKLMLEARTRAAVAAAIAGSEAEARANAAKEMDIQNQPRRQKQPLETRGLPAVEAKPRAASSEPQAQPSGAETAATDLSSEFEPAQRLAFSWQVFSREMMRALQTSLIMFAVFLAFVYFTTGRYPWEGFGDQDSAAPLQESGEL